MGTWKYNVNSGAVTQDLVIYTGEASSEEEARNFLIQELQNKRVSILMDLHHVTRILDKHRLIQEGWQRVDGGGFKKEKAGVKAFYNEENSVLSVELAVTIPDTTMEEIDILISEKFKNISEEWENS